MWLDRVACGGALIGKFGACFGWLPSGAATASAQPQVDEPTPEVDEEKVTVTDVDASVPTQIAEPESVGSPGTADAAEAKPKALQKMGLMTGIAIALHNFPEGLATFVGTRSSRVDPPQRLAIQKSQKAAKSRKRSQTGCSGV